MITGNVIGRHALVPVTFRLPNSPDLTVEFVVDTGYTDYLTLPSAAVSAMGLPFLHRIPADLADDSTVEIDVYRATVIWHGQETVVPVLATGRRPLLGTGMLFECDFATRFIEGGTVIINKIDVNTGSNSSVDVNIGSSTIGPKTAAVIARRETQRQRALDDPSQGL